jgi:cytidylate kinase
VVVPVEGKKLRVAISGKSGCGNTTVSSLLAKKLNITFINFTFRSLAAEMNLSLKDIIHQAKTNDWFDRTVDTRQIELAMKGSCVLGSRLAIWMLKEADLRVFLTASEEVRAARIQKREGGTIEEITCFTQKRDAEDSRRYKELYRIDNSEFSFADVIIDTETIEPPDIVALIIDVLLKRTLVRQVDD